MVHKSQETALQCHVLALQCRNMVLRCHGIGVVAQRPSAAALLPLRHQVSKSYGTAVPIWYCNAQFCPISSILVLLHTANSALFARLHSQLV
ncbi:hypothetical protein PanWU01x14_344200 [Parasponia andersonii]|uniref:Uncharacterized protein n=1 Tax=Parasponia andersonii TaxID=3476 RepID=A0A2P5AD40_PARAD|nr:hypothetical protein PanWU01x14_344200 [Parasponia andersonii]